MNQTKHFRTLAVSLSTYGFGYAVMEGQMTLVSYGKKVLKGDKNALSLAQIDKMIIAYKPDVLVLHDVNAKGSQRSPRIKELDKKIVELALGRKLKVKKFSGTKLRSLILGNPEGTKQEMAEFLAKQFPDELASRLPPKRKSWKSQDVRMDIFDAVALVTAVSGSVKGNDE